MSVPQRSNWYPTRTQVSDPDKLMAAFKQVLDQHYALLHQVNQMKAEGAKSAGASGPAPAGPPPGSGPIDSQLLGLRVLPVNPSSLAGGEVLTYVKKDGNLQLL